MSCSEPKEASSEMKTCSTDGIFNGVEKVSQAVAIIFEIRERSSIFRVKHLSEKSIIAGDCVEKEIATRFSECFRPEERIAWKQFG